VGVACTVSPLAALNERIETGIRCVPNRHAAIHGALLVDPAHPYHFVYEDGTLLHNKALISLSLSGVGGFQFLDLPSGLFEGAFASKGPVIGSYGSSISEDSLLDPIRGRLLSASEANNYEIVDVTNSAVPVFYENGITGITTPGHLDSSGEDCATGIALAPAEFTSNVYLADLTQATFTPGTPGKWTAPSRVQILSESSSLSSGANGIAVPQGTHTGIVSGEFGGDAITAIALPTTSGSGTPAITDWVTCHIGGSFINGDDPHTLTAYMSPGGSPGPGGGPAIPAGHAVAVLVNSGATQLAVVDLTKMLTLSRTTGAGFGHACASPGAPGGVLPSTVVSFVTVK
jgi:hypothetical protein